MGRNRVGALVVVVVGSVTVTGALVWSSSATTGAVGVATAAAVSFAAATVVVAMLAQMA
jgi:hypothetical protein